MTSRAGFRGHPRAAHVAALAAFVVAAVSLAGSAVAAPAAASKATLKVVKLKPFTARAAGFKAGERVTATLSGGARGIARGTATATGTVTLTFPKTAIVTNCTSYAVRAVGAKGTVAIYKHPAPATCKATAAVTFSGTSVVISGKGFKAGETISLTFVANEIPHKRTVKASTAGTFSANLGSLGISECSPYKLTLVGSLGSRFAETHEALPC